MGTRTRLHPNVPIPLNPNPPPTDSVFGHGIARKTPKSRCRSHPSTQQRRPVPSPPPTQLCTPPKEMLNDTCTIRMQNIYKIIIIIQKRTHAFLCSHRFKWSVNRSNHMFSLAISALTLSLLMLVKNVSYETQTQYNTTTRAPDTAGTLQRPQLICVTMEGGCDSGRVWITGA